MSSAKLYTSTNVVDRLTRPLNPQPQTSADDGLRAFDSSFSGEKGGNVMDMASFLNSLNGQNSGYSTPNSTSQKGRARSAFSLRRSASSSGFADDKSEQSHSARPSAEDIKARRKKFEQFIGRQENITRRRQENLNMVLQ